MSEKNDDQSSRRSALKNVKWVSHFLGVSRGTVHQWVLEGHIPYINLGVAGGRRIIRFDPDAIESWLEERSHLSGKDAPNREDLNQDLEAKLDEEEPD
jgi:excisionase family DNA binding protein